MRAARIILLCFVMELACSLFAQQKESERGDRRVVTTTRLVAVFSELENRWLQAVQHRDAAALNHLLSENFQEWTPKALGPVSVEDWQQRAFAHTLTSFRFRQMAVRSLNEETMVASFVLIESVQSRGKPDEFFVVDIWSKQGDRWVCTDRYSSPLTSVGVEDVKPNGKQ